MTSKAVVQVCGRCDFLYFSVSERAWADGGRKPWLEPAVSYKHLILVTKSASYNSFMSKMSWKTEQRKLSLIIPK